MTTATKPAPALAGTHPRVGGEPTPLLSTANPHAAVEAALEVLRIETQARLAEIPGRLQAMIARANRGNPDKRDQRKRDAQAWADQQETLILQNRADREAELLTGLRAVELGALEALRGGEVRMEVRDIETVILKGGAPIWFHGRKSTKRERVTRPYVTSRDGLHTLATAHLKANGEPMLMQDRKTPMLPIFTAAQLAALEAYRGEYLATREVSLPAVDASGAGEDRTPFNVMRSNTLENLFTHGKRAVPFGKLEAKVSRLAGREALLVLRAVAGEGHTIRSLAPGRRRAIRLTQALLRAADVLADRMGLQ